MDTTVISAGFDGAQGCMVVRYADGTVARAANVGGRVLPLPAAVAAAFDLIDEAAIGTGVDADGIADGSDDWDHPSAADARAVTKILGMEWDFTTWADARLLAEEAAGA